jgi:RHO1 GDP-GTP exchange protein 1/2
VDLESLDTQGLLDPSDESLEFVKKKENLRPMAIYRIENEFLLCYDGNHHHHSLCSGFN